MVLLQSNAEIARSLDGQYYCTRALGALCRHLYSEPRINKAAPKFMGLLFGGIGNEVKELRFATATLLGLSNH
mgnify:CR=1 FL=1